MKVQRKKVRILILTSGGLGDNVVQTAFINAILCKHLGQNYTDHFTCTVIAWESNISLYQNYPIDTTFILKKRQYKTSLWKDIYGFILMEHFKHHYTIIIDLKRSGLLWIFALMGVKYYMVPRSRNLNHSYQNHITYATHIVQSLKGLHTSSPKPYVPISHNNQQTAQQWLTKHIPGYTGNTTDPNRPIIVVAHASILGRIWDLNSYIHFIQAVHKENPKQPIIIMGSKQSQTFYQPVLKQCPYCIPLIDTLDLTVLAALFHHAKAYIGPDTGVLHLADVQKCPILCVFVTKQNYQSLSFMPTYAPYISLGTEKIYDEHVVKQAQQSLLSPSTPWVMWAYHTLTNPNSTYPTPPGDMRIVSNIQPSRKS